MARASIITAIPIDRVAYYLQIDPYHFNSIYTELHPIQNCDDDWYQWGWQFGGKLSRENLAMALKSAEQLTFNYLGWFPIPQWTTEDNIKLPDHYKTEVWNVRYNSQGNTKSIKTKWGYLLEAGYKDSTYIDTPATVFSDDDGDGYEETVTITFATTVSDAQELHVFFAGKEGNEQWEIRPLDYLDVTGGIATIKFKKYLIPVPTLWERMRSTLVPAIAIDGDDDSNFETEVDVYRVFNNPSKNIEFISESHTETGEMKLRKTVEGFFSYAPATWDATTETWTASYFNYRPLYSKIYYRSGFRDTSLAYPDLQMREDLERLIVNYALTKLTSKLCGCDSTVSVWEHATEDLARQGEGVSYVIQWSETTNPFGTTRAALELWKYAQAIKLGGSPYAN